MSSLIIIGICASIFFIALGACVAIDILLSPSRKHIRPEVQHLALLIPTLPVNDPCDEQVLHHIHPRSDNGWEIMHGTVQVYALGYLFGRRLWGRERRLIKAAMKEVKKKYKTDFWTNKVEKHIPVVETEVDDSEALREARAEVERLSAKVAQLSALHHQDWPVAPITDPKITHDGWVITNDGKLMKRSDLPI